MRVAAGGAAGVVATLTLGGGEGTVGDIGSGSVEFVEGVQRYVFLGSGGDPGGLGVYVAFSDALLGPWVNATLVATHATSGASCYNGMHLPAMDEGSTIHFACTCTSMWSSGGAGPGVDWDTCLFGLNPHAQCSPVVPRYEYNNLVYAVDLSAVLVG